MGRRSGGAPDADLDALGRTSVAEHRPSSLIGRLAGAEAVASPLACLCTLAASATAGAALRAGGGLKGLTGTWPGPAAGPASSHRRPSRRMSGKRGPARLGRVDQAFR